MEQNGEYLINASRAVVWQSLNDPEVLAQCIDGCLEMAKTSDNQFDARVKAKIGPVSATFNAQLLLSNIQAPDSYTITASVKGGAAGFGKGVANVSLADGPAADTTQLAYTVDASVGGKLAQIGSRLLDGAARKMADDFFSAFGELVGGAADPVAAVGAVDAAATVEGEPLAATELEDNNEYNWVIWAVVFGALGIALLLAL